MSEHENFLDAQEKLVRERAKAERRRHFDLDVRGLLAIITIIGFFLVVFAQLVISTVQGASAAGSIRIPAEVAAVVTGVAGFYFGSRSGPNGHGKP